MNHSHAESARGDSRHRQQHNPANTITQHPQHIFAGVTKQGFDDLWTFFFRGFLHVATLKAYQRLARPPDRQWMGDLNRITPLPGDWMLIKG